MPVFTERHLGASESRRTNRSSSMPRVSKKAVAWPLFRSFLSAGLACLIVLMAPNAIQAYTSPETLPFTHDVVHDGDSFGRILEQFETAQSSISSGNEQVQGSRETSAQGNDHLLQGSFCHWSGSSGGGSGYSHSIRVYFDGRGRFQYSSESAFNGGTGLAFGTERDASNSGAYRVAGDQLFLSFSDGSTGVPFVHNRKADGTITELMYEGDLYAPALCK